MGKFWDQKIFVKIHYDYNRYRSIQIFSDLIFCDSELLQKIPSEINSNPQY
mgnify:CR=1 FL=1